LVVNGYQPVGNDSDVVTVRRYLTRFQCFRKGHVGRPVGLAVVHLNAVAIVFQIERLESELNFLSLGDLDEPVTYFTVVTSDSTVLAGLMATVTLEAGGLRSAPLPIRLASALNGAAQNVSRVTEKLESGHVGRAARVEIVTVRKLARVSTINDRALCIVAGPLKVRLTFSELFTRQSETFVARQISSVVDVVATARI